MFYRTNIRSVKGIYEVISSTWSRRESQSSESENASSSSPPGSSPWRTLERLLQLVDRHRDRSRDGACKRERAVIPVECLLDRVDLLLQLSGELLELILRLLAVVGVGRPERLQVVDEILRRALGLIDRVANVVLAEVEPSGRERANRLVDVGDPLAEIAADVVGPALGAALVVAAAASRRERESDARSTSMAKAPAGARCELTSRRSRDDLGGRAAHPRETRHDVEDALAGAEADVLLEARRPVRPGGQAGVRVGIRRRDDLGREGGIGRLAVRSFCTSRPAQ